MGQGIPQTYTGDSSAHYVWQGSYLKGMFFDKTQCDGVYLHTIIEEGHPAFSIDPYHGYILDTIPLVEEIGI